MKDIHEIPVPLPIGGPEQIFRVSTSTIHEGGARASMETGAWVVDADGTPSAGSLGVLLDDALGYAILATRPEGRWSVSTEIGVEMCSLSGWQHRGPLVTEAAVVHHDAIGGLATARIVDAAGGLVAICTQRGRFVQRGEGGVSITPFSPPESQLTAPDPSSLIDATTTGPGMAAASFHIGPWLQNPMGNLHGGVTIFFVERLAQAALTTTDGPPLAIASIQVTYPRAVKGGTTATFEAMVRHRGRGLAVVDVTGSTDGRTAVSATVVAQPAS